MNSSEIDQEDIYKELPSLTHSQQDILKKPLIDLPIEDQQQPFYEPLPFEDGNTNPTVTETLQPLLIANINQSVIHAVLSLQQPVKCTRCKVQKTMADFGYRRNGERLKICRRCTLVRKIGLIMSTYRRAKRQSIKSWYL